MVLNFFDDEKTVLLKKKTALKGKKLFFHKVQSVMTSTSMPEQTMIYNEWIH